LYGSGSQNNVGELPFHLSEAHRNVELTTSNTAIFARRGAHRGVLYVFKRRVPNRLLQILWRIDLNARLYRVPRYEMYLDADPVRERAELLKGFTSGDR
jgi:hypothetical protein